MRMMSIASGSSGNCIYIGTETTHILIDDGISKKKVVEGLSKLDLKLDDLNAILITHEHSDHIGGLGVLERQAAIPIYGTDSTLNYIKNETKLGKMPEGIYNSIKAEEVFSIGDITVESVRISHDAVDPVAYVLSYGDKKAGVVTDLGFYNEQIISKFSNLNSLLIESNHDINMLMTGPYTYMLKQRILGDKGHLSNEACGKLLCELLGNRTDYVFLGHLSKENNFPELAFETVRCEINQGEQDFVANDFNIQVAKREMPSDIVIF